MKGNGFTVQVEDVPNLADVKTRYQVPFELQSCHTAIVDGYVIEGHVPVAEIRKLLDERPNIVGLSVPGMPVGAPGMEVEGANPAPFDVIAFNSAGKTEIFARYP